MFNLEQRIDMRVAQINTFHIPQSDKKQIGFYADLMKGMGDIFSGTPIAKNLIQLGTLNKLEGRRMNAGLQIFGVFLGLADNIIKAERKKKRK